MRGCLWLGLGEGCVKVCRGVLVKYRVSFQSGENVLKLHSGEGYTTSNILKITG